MEENTDKNRDKRLDNLIPWKEGDKSPNPNGRPLGQRNYATIYREAMEMLANKNATTPEKLEAEIIANGILSARKGDFRFYKDTLDRLHGTAVQKGDLTSGGDKIMFLPTEVIKKINATTSETKPSDTV